MAERQCLRRIYSVGNRIFPQNKTKMAPKRQVILTNNKQPVLLRFVRDYFCNLKNFAHNIQYCNVLRDNDNDDVMHDERKRDSGGQT